MNPKLKSAFCLLPFALCLFSGCQTPHKTQNAPFPEIMVGTWETWFSPEQLWQITFEENGTISEIIHNVFGPLKVKDGGIDKDGPHPGTFLVAVLGPFESEYDARANKVKVSIEIESYTMKFVEGELKGRMIDKFEGATSKDGQTWEVEWRDYGWLEGAAEPPIDVIDANPRMIKFRKIEKAQ